MSSPGRDRRVNIPNRREKETSSPTSWKAPPTAGPNLHRSRSHVNRRLLANPVSLERTVDEDVNSVHEPPKACPKITHSEPPHGPGWSNMTLGRTCLSS